MTLNFVCMSLPTEKKKTISYMIETLKYYKLCWFFVPLDIFKVIKLFSLTFFLRVRILSYSSYLDRANNIDFIATIATTTAGGKTESTAIWPDVVTVLISSSFDISVTVVVVFRFDTVVVTVVVVGVVVGAWRYQGDKTNIMIDIIDITNY